MLDPGKNLGFTWANDLTSPYLNFLIFKIEIPVFIGLVVVRIFVFVFKYKIFLFEYFTY